MQELVNINLSGGLGKEVGKTWNLAVKSVGEAIHAINILTDHKLTKYLHKKEKVGAKYQIVINGRNFCTDKKLDEKHISNIQNSELVINQKLYTVDIVPVIEGAGKGAGIFTAILGAVLIVVGAIIALAPGAQPIAGYLIVAGIGLVAAGAATLLAQPPKFEDFREFESSSSQARSYLFNGPQNDLREGGPVPVVYGEVITGSQTIAAASITEYERVSTQISAELTGRPDLDWRPKSELEFAINRSKVFTFDFHPTDRRVLAPVRIHDKRERLYILAYWDQAVRNTRIFDIDAINDTFHARLHSIFTKKNTYWGHDEFKDDERDPKVQRPVRFIPYPANSIEVSQLEEIGEPVVAKIKTDAVRKRVYIGGVFSIDQGEEDRRQTIGVGTNPTSPLKNWREYQEVSNFIALNEDGHGFISDDYTSDFRQPRTDGVICAMDILSGGDIIIGGNFENVAGGPVDNLTTQKYVARIDVATGNTVSFTAATDPVKNILVDPEDNIFLAMDGSVTSPLDGTNYLIKVDSSGNTVTAFSVPASLNGPVWALAISGSDLFFGGDFTTADGSTTNQGLCKVNRITGAVDTNFTFSASGLDSNTPSAFANKEPWRTSKIGIVNGSTTETSDRYLDLYNVDVPANELSIPRIRSIDVQEDGKILVAGAFVNVLTKDDLNNEIEADVCTRSLVRLNTLGTVDLSFNANTSNTTKDGVYGSIHYVKTRQGNGEADDNKIFISGFITKYNAEGQFTQADKDLYSTVDITIGERPKDLSYYNIMRIFS